MGWSIPPSFCVSLYVYFLKWDANLKGSLVRFLCIGVGAMSCQHPRLYPSFYFFVTVWCIAVFEGLDSRIIRSKCLLIILPFLGDIDRSVFFYFDLSFNLYILPVASWLRSKSSQSKCRGTCS